MGNHICASCKRSGDNHKYCPDCKDYFCVNLIDTHYCDGYRFGGTPTRINGGIKTTDNPTEDKPFYYLEDEHIERMPKQKNTRIKDGIKTTNNPTKDTPFYYTENEYMERTREQKNVSASDFWSVIIFLIILFVSAYLIIYQ